MLEAPDNDEDEFRTRRVYRPEEWSEPKWLYDGMSVWIWVRIEEQRKLAKYKVLKASGDAGYVEPDFEGCESFPTRWISINDMLILREKEPHICW